MFLKIILVKLVEKNHFKWVLKKKFFCSSKNIFNSSKTFARAKNFFFARASDLLEHAREKFLLIFCQMLLQIDIFDLKFVFMNILNVKLNFSRLST
jgi:hypothetical protein